jgi:uncharacterized protein YndB with AHSA1/START domain
MRFQPPWGGAFRLQTFVHQTPEALSAETIESIQSAILDSPLLGGTNLTSQFSGTYGFSISFRREALLEVVGQFPAFAPFLDAVIRPGCNVFLLNPLLIQNGRGVRAHVDGSLKFYSSRMGCPVAVSVLYVQVPPQLAGGELRLYHRGRRVAALTPIPRTPGYVSGRPGPRGRGGRGRSFGTLGGAHQPGGRAVPCAGAPAIAGAPLGGAHSHGGVAMSELAMDVVVPHPPKEVFTAFEDSFRLRRWYGAPPGCFRTGADGSVLPGQSFRVDMMDAAGDSFAQLGRILEVEPGNCLRLEMAWEGGKLSRDETRVSIFLQPADGGTRVEVRQGPFSTVESMEAHRDYWRANLDRLARVVNGEALPCFEELWEESLGFVEPLGMAAYAVLAGLREAGAAPELVTQVEDTLYTHLAHLPEETAGMLGAVLRERLKELSS